MRWYGHVSVCGLTFEFTRPAEAGGVSPVCDDATAGTHRAYTACRSGSGVQRGVRPQFTVQTTRNYGFGTHGLYSMDLATFWAE